VERNAEGVADDLEDVAVVCFDRFAQDGVVAGAGGSPAAGSACANLVLPSMSVKRKVTVPLGSEDIMAPCGRTTSTALLYSTVRDDMVGASKSQCGRMYSKMRVAWGRAAFVLCIAFITCWLRQPEYSKHIRQ
jgi:hypothetical protein